MQEHLGNELPNICHTSNSSPTQVSSIGMHAANHHRFGCVHGVDLMVVVSHHAMLSSGCDCPQYCQYRVTDNSSLGFLQHHT